MNANKFKLGFTNAAILKALIDTLINDSNREEYKENLRKSITDYGLKEIEQFPDKSLRDDLKTYFQYFRQQI